MCICMHFCFIKSNANQGGMMLYCIKAVTYMYIHIKEAVMQSGNMQS